MKKGPLFSVLFKETDPPERLYGAISARIHELERRSAALRLGLFSVVALLSGIALVPAVQYALGQLYTSGFYDYFSLLFSDSSFVLAYPREFVLSLAESLPSIAVLLLIPIVFALVWSLRRAVQTYRFNYV
jgi:hypothetical protein